MSKSVPAPRNQEQCSGSGQHAKGWDDNNMAVCHVCGRHVPDTTVSTSRTSAHGVVVSDVNWVLVSHTPEGTAKQKEPVK